ncbi:Ubiquitinyl hydrolase 1 [Bertholletia excelsa]
MEMIMHEIDPDVVRWGLHLLDGCCLPGDYSSSTIHYEKDLSRIEYVKEGFSEIKCNEVENDEIIARTLQEELSELAAAEACGSSRAVEEHLQESVLAQDWQGADERGKPDSCSSMEAESQPYSPEIAHESTLDGEVGKRLNQMVPVPHVPKINGVIPSADEQISDHSRLLERLRLYDLVELKVEGDGNCQFRALSDQIYRAPDHHKFVRERVVDQLKSHPELYEGCVPMGYDAYLKQIGKTGEWGDHVTLQAAADAYGVKIFIITSFKETCYVEILPHTEKSKRIIFLSFWAEVHYNSIYPEGELPVLEMKKKKRWWIL